MRYEEEYKLCKNDREIFTRAMNENYPHLKNSSIKREFSTLKKELGYLVENEIFINGKKYDIKKNKVVEEIEKQDDKIEEINEEILVANEIIKENKIPITLGKLYPLDEKTQPSYNKLRELEEIKYLGYAPTRNMLIRHGFTQTEINYLDEADKLKVK